jgi:hypothetical protein
VNLRVLIDVMQASNERSSRSQGKGRDRRNISVLQRSDLEIVTELMEAELPNVESSLGVEMRGIERYLY